MTFNVIPHPRLERWRCTHRYRTSGRKFCSYYRWLCVRCGASVHRLRVRSHTQGTCDMVLSSLAHCGYLEHAKRRPCPCMFVAHANRVTTHVLMKGLE